MDKSCPTAFRLRETERRLRGGSDQIGSAIALDDGVMPITDSDLLAQHTDTRSAPQQHDETPSLEGMMTGRPPRRMAAAELEVPRSMPMVAIACALK